MQTNKTSKPTKKASFKVFQPGELILDGKYEIVKKIGEGGMSSVVYLAKNLTIKKDTYFDYKKMHVAVKVITKTKDVDEADWIKFQNEIKTHFRTQSLTSGKKYVVEIYDAKIEEETIYIVMEYVNGDTLRKILSKKKSLNVQDSIYILKKILLVIQDIHNLPHKLIHRDLKPENIMLSGDLTEIKIFDFGIAMTLKNENLTDTIFDQESFFTKDDEIFGTAYYLTPQILEVRQFKNDKEKFNEILNKIGVQFDFYALGIIFYEMLTGAKPFIIPEGKDESKVLNIAANYDIPIISEMNTPPEAENIILRLTASKNFNTKGEWIRGLGMKPLPGVQNPIQMYKSVEEIIDDVEKLQKDVEENNLTELNQPLLKPLKDRRFQTKDKFIDIPNIKTHWYEETWFYTTFTIIGVLVLVFVIILFYVY